MMRKFLLCLALLLSADVTAAATINGQLKKACLENLTADPTPGCGEGRMFWDSDDNLFRFHNGTAWRTVVDTTTALANPSTTGVFIDGSADELQLRVQGHSTQTNDTVVKFESINSSVSATLDVLDIHRAINSATSGVGLKLSLLDSGSAEQEYGYIGVKSIDTTAGAEDGQLVFAVTQAGTARNSVAEVDSNGYWGFGSSISTNDSFVGIKHDAMGAGDYGSHYDDTDSVVTSNIMSLMEWSVDTDASGGTYIQFNDASGEIGSITSATATTVAYNTTSDARLKHDIADVTNGLETVKSIRPRTYKWNEDDSVGIGFIAQELKEVYPSAVTGSPSGNVATDPMQVDYSKLTPILAAAIKELSSKLDTLQADYDAYKLAHP